MRRADGAIEVLGRTDNQVKVAATVLSSKQSKPQFCAIPASLLRQPAPGPKLRGTCGSVYILLPQMMPPDLASPTSAHSCKTAFRKA